MGSRITWVNSAVTSAYRFNSCSHFIEGKMFVQCFWVSSTMAAMQHEQEKRKSQAFSDSGTTQQSQYNINRLIYEYIPHFIHSLHNVLREVHSIIQSKFSTQCDLVLPLSVSSILQFPSGHPLADYVFFLPFPSLLSCFLSPRV